MKKLILAFLALALALLAGVAAGCGGDLSGNAVAKVGDVEITEDVFNQRLQEFGAQYGYSEDTTDAKTWGLFKLDVLEYLITYQMAAQKAKDYGVEVTDQDVQTEIDNIVTTYYDGDEEAFNQDLASSNMTLDQLKANYKESMLTQKVYEKVVADVPEPTDEEIAAYYEQNKDDFYVAETRVVRHILIAPGGQETSDTTSTTAVSESSTSTTVLTDADWATALATAQKVRNLLLAGGDWKELAAKYSDDPGTANNGGDLGTIEEGKMLPEFDEAAFSLKLNEISEPVKTAYGYHIIQVTTINEGHQKTLEEATDEIKSLLLSKKQSEVWKQWLADTKVELHVVYRADMQPTTTVSTESSTTSVSVGASDGTTTGASTTADGSTVTGAETTTTATP